MSELVEIEKLIGDYTSVFKTLEAGLNGQAMSKVHQKRKDALAAFNTLGFPSMKHEEWKYTYLKKALNHNFQVNLTQSLPGIDSKSVQKHFLIKKSNIRLVFVDGIFNNELSILPIINKNRFSNLSAEFKTGDHWLQEHFAKYLDIQNEALAALNVAFAQDGAYIHLSENQTIEETIEIYDVLTGNNRSLIQPHHIIQLEENAEANIVHAYIHLGDQPVFANCVTEIFQETSSRLHYTKIEDLENNSYIIDNVKVAQGTKSYFTSNTATLSGNLVRNNLAVLLTGQFTETHLMGLYLPDGEEHIDNHTLVDHAQPNCYSNELYKGILGGHSTGVFNGKVMVRPDAQKTNAFQSNKNILVSDDATLNTKPQLEIFADDVKCSHGCTSAQIDNHELFYLLTRGIGKEVGKGLLMFAFAEETLEMIKDKEIKNHIEKRVSQKLGLDI